MPISTHPSLTFLRQVIEAAVAVLFYWLFRILPIDMASGLGGWLARNIGHR